MKNLVSQSQKSWKSSVLPAKSKVETADSRNDLIEVQSESQAASMLEETSWGSITNNVRQKLTSEGSPPPKPNSSLNGLLNVQLKIATGGSRVVQRADSGESTAKSDISSIHRIATAGVSGQKVSFPHQDRIQASFGRHSISHFTAHTDGSAKSATKAINAEAYATGTSAAFSKISPDLHTAAHEAAHLIQQQGGVQLKGGIGGLNDEYERHADAVADNVVAGQSAEILLDDYASKRSQPQQNSSTSANVIQGKFDLPDSSEIEKLGGGGIYRVFQLTSVARNIVESIDNSSKEEKDAAIVAVHSFLSLVDQEKKHFLWLTVRERAITLGTEIIRHRRKAENRRLKRLKRLKKLLKSRHKEQTKEQKKKVTGKPSKSGTIANAQLPNQNNIIQSSEVPFVDDEKINNNCDHLEPNVASPNVNGLAKSNTSSSLSDIQTLVSFYSTQAYSVANDSTGDNDNSENTLEEKKADDFKDELKVAKGTVKLGDVQSTAEKVDSINNSILEAPTQLLGNDGKSGAIDVAFREKDSTSPRENLSSSEKDLFSKLGFAADSFTFLRGITSIASSVDKAKKEGKDEKNKKSTATKIRDYIEGVSDTASLAEGASKMVGAFGDTSAAKVGSVAEGAACGLDTIKSIFVIIQNLKKWGDSNKNLENHEKGDLNTDVNATKRIRSLVELMEGSKSAITAIKAFLEAFSGAASASLATMMPVMSVAIAGAKMIMQAYYACKSYNRAAKMESERTKLIKASYEKDSLGTKSVKEFEQRLNNSDIRKREEDAVTANSKKEIDKTSNENDWKELEAIKKDNLAKVPSKKVSKDGEEKPVINDGEMVAKYSLTQELVDINRKRWQRQTIHLASNLLQVTGDFLIILSGGTAGLAGAGLKAVSGGIEGGTLLARYLKQMGRDKKAETVSKKGDGKVPLYLREYSQYKSTPAKQSRRIDLACNLLAMIHEAVPTEKTDDLSDQGKKDATAKVGTVSSYIDAVGLNPEIILSIGRGKEPKLNTLIEIIVAGLSQREMDIEDDNRVMKNNIRHRTDKPK